MLHFRHSVLVHAERLRDTILFEQRRPGTSRRIFLRTGVSGRLLWCTKLGLSLCQ
jgi:hypothetical protein